MVLDFPEPFGPTMAEKDCGSPVNNKANQRIEFVPCGKGRFLAVQRTI